MCKSLELCDGILIFLSTTGLPPAVLDFNLEVSHTAFLEYIVEFIGTINEVAMGSISSATMHVYCISSDNTGRPY